jgi:ParB-like chromosome segregation protein Spo0J
LAARKLGITQIPTIDLPWLTETERQAYIIADNKLAENAGWDTETLRLELGGLKELGFDLALTGFGDIELGALFADKTAGLTDPDEVPVAPEQPVSEPGDLWLLGAKVTCPKCRKTTPLERAVRRT